MQTLWNSIPLVLLSRVCKLKHSWMRVAFKKTVCLWLTLLRQSITLVTHFKFRVFSFVKHFADVWRKQTWGYWLKVNEWIGLFSSFDLVPSLVYIYCGGEWFPVPCLLNFRDGVLTRMVAVPSTKGPFCFAFLDCFLDERTLRCVNLIIATAKESISNR